MPIDALVEVHSLLRWVVLAAGAATLAVALVGWLGFGIREVQARSIMLAYAVSLDVQVLLGALIWLSEQRWAGGERQLRLDHPLVMLVALAVVHVAAARARRTRVHKNAAQIRTIGSAVSLLLILAGIPWARLKG